MFLLLLKYIFDVSFQNIWTMVEWSLMAYKTLKKTLSMLHIYLQIWNYIVYALSLELHLKLHIFNYKTQSNLMKNWKWLFSAYIWYHYNRLSFYVSFLKWDFNHYIFISLHGKTKGSLILKLWNPHFSCRALFFQQNSSLLDWFFSYTALNEARWDAFSSLMVRMPYRCISKPQ